MRIKIPRKTLLNIAQTVQGVVSTKNTLPILSNMLIDARKDKLLLVATDLDIAMVYTIKMDSSQEGATTVSAKRFTDIIKELPEEDVVISAKKNNTITIDCSNSHFKVASLPTEEFPKLPSYKNQEFITIEQEILKDMLNKTSFAISRDETRYILNGVLIEIKTDKITLVATDGRRMAYTERKVETKGQKPKKMIIPTKTINELNKTLKEGPMKIHFGENQTTFDLGDIVIISRLIEGEYPQYEQVIPKEQKEKLKVKRDDLLAAAKRASLLTNQDSQAIKLDIFKTKVVISKNTPDIGEAREEISATYNNDNLTIGFNPTYLIDALKNIDQEEIGLELTTQDKPGVIRQGSDFIYVVLPMQLG